MIDVVKELDIKIIDRGESFYQNRMIDVVKELESKSKSINIISFPEKKYFVFF